MSHITKRHQSHLIQTAVDAHIGRLFEGPPTTTSDEAKRKQNIRRRAHDLDDRRFFATRCGDKDS